MNILAIETSCDETSVAVVKNGVEVLSQVTASSSDLFIETGGVVPEVAARAQLEYIIPVYKKCIEQADLSLNNIDYIAVTVGPGLVGSLFVGVNFAKSLSLLTNKKIIPVNHLHGHIYSVFIKKYLNKTITKKNVDFPAICLVVSGGHTDLILLTSNTKITYLGGTRDDAVGESFDKVSRVLGIQKYLGGPKLSILASKYKNKPSIKLPRPLINSGDFEFSFSGLKTAVIKEVKNHTPDELAFEFEQAVCDVLVYKTKEAVKEYSPKSVILCGGVSANTVIREGFIKNFKNVFIPPVYLCTDNASMIGSAAYFYAKNATSDLSKIEADPSLSLQ